MKAERSAKQGGSVRSYLGVSARFASSCTDLVVADLSIVYLADRPHASGGSVICLANTRKLRPSGATSTNTPTGLAPTELNFPYGAF
jgi:hypothetical protein